MLADIPGLIEGASGGKGLGHTFLRHIARTLILIHCVSLESDDPLRDYETVRIELEKYSDSLSRKPEIIVLTKKDLVTPEEIETATLRFKEKFPAVVVVSTSDEESIKQLGDSIVQFLKKGSI